MPTGAFSARKVRNSDGVKPKLFMLATREAPISNFQVPNKLQSYKSQKRGVCTDLGDLELEISLGLACGLGFGAFVVAYAVCATAATRAR